MAELVSIHGKPLNPNASDSVVKKHNAQMQAKIDEQAESIEMLHSMVKHLFVVSKYTIGELPEGHAFGSAGAIVINHMTTVLGEMPPGYLEDSIDQLIAHSEGKH